jgi:hypothetical protein
VGIPFTVHVTFAVSFKLMVNGLVSPTVPLTIEFCEGVGSAVTPGAADAAPQNSPNTRIAVNICKIAFFMFYPSKPCA